MTVTDINTEEACQVAVSQAMKHMRPDEVTESLNVEETMPRTISEVSSLVLYSTSVS